MRRWIVFGAIAVIIGGVWLWNEVSSVQRADDGTVESAGSEGVVDLRVGDCVVALGLEEADSEVTDASVTVVPCAESHRYEVYAVDHDAYSDLETFNSTVVDGRADAHCLDTFSSYTGDLWDESEFYFTALIPTAESWASGDRGLSCVLHYENLELWQGSARS